MADLKLTFQSKCGLFACSLLMTVLCVAVFVLRAHGQFEPRNSRSPPVTTRKVPTVTPPRQNNDREIGLAPNSTAGVGIGIKPTVLNTTIELIKNNTSVPKATIKTNATATNNGTAPSTTAATITITTSKLPPPAIPVTTTETSSENELDAQIPSNFEAGKTTKSIDVKRETELHSNLNEISTETELESNSKINAYSSKDPTTVVSTSPSPAGAGTQGQGHSQGQNQSQGHSQGQSQSSQLDPPSTLSPTQPTIYGSQPSVATSTANDLDSSAQGHARPNRTQSSEELQNTGIDYGLNIGNNAETVEDSGSVVGSSSDGNGDGKGTKNEVIRRPRLTVFAFNNYNGPSETFELLSDKCTTLPEDWHKRVSSVHTHGDCIEVCQFKNCIGRCFPMAPGTPGQSRLRDINFDKRIASMRCCLSYAN